MAGLPVVDTEVGRAHSISLARVGCGGIARSVVPMDLKLPLWHASGAVTRPLHMKIIYRRGLLHELCQNTLFSSPGLTAGAGCERRDGFEPLSALPVRAGSSSRTDYGRVWRAASLRPTGRLTLGRSGASDPTTWCGLRQILNRWKLLRTISPADQLRAAGSQWSVSVRAVLPEPPAGHQLEL